MPSPAVLNFLLVASLLHPSLRAVLTEVKREKNNLQMLSSYSIPVLEGQAQDLPLQV